MEEVEHGREKGAREEGREGERERSILAWEGRKEGGTKGGRDG